MRKGPNLMNFTDEVGLDLSTIQDIQEMYRSCPAIVLARKSFLSKTIGEPFSFSIPAIGITSNRDMEKIISFHWMPFLRTVYDWCQMIGICPYYFEKLGNSEHRVPVVPDMDLGYITVVVNKKHHLEYKWYWSHGVQTEQQADMLWIMTEHRPTNKGIIRSPLATLLPTWSSLMKLKRAQDVAVTQRARPVHIMEHANTKHMHNNDELSTLVADFGSKAAGISKARREAQIQQNIRVKTAELYRSLQQASDANHMKSTIQPTLWTETPADTLEEMDAGFSNRVIVMREDFKYSQAAKPEVIVDYYKAEMQFNTTASAVMGFAMEHITPTGGARSQNVQGALDFENDRIREQASFFQSVLQSALIIAYKDQFQQVMDDARHWRISKLGGDPQKVAFLYPELDVQIDLSSASVTTYEEMKAMHMDGLITKETFGTHVFKNRNLPLEDMVTLQWPDKVPKEMLVRAAAAPGGGGGGGSKPPKKKPKVAAAPKASAE